MILLTTTYEVGFSKYYPVSYLLFKVASNDPTYCACTTPHPTPTHPSHIGVTHTPYIHIHTKICITLFHKIHIYKILIYKIFIYKFLIYKNLIYKILICKILIFKIRICKFLICKIIICKILICKILIYSSPISSIFLTICNLYGPLDY